MRKLLAEAYRPTTLDGYIFTSSELKTAINRFIKKQEIPNLLLSGTQGTGKTTLSRILVTELGIQDIDVLTINASLMGVDDIRNKIEPFVKKMGFSKFKLVQLEEADRISLAGQQSLRSIIEDSSDKVRWIATCNFPNKIIPPLLSRFQHFHIESLPEDDLIEYILDVVEREGLTFSEENDLLSHIDTYTPDVRKILNSIDQHTTENKVIEKLSSSVSSSDADEFLEILKSGKAKRKIDRLLELAVNVDQNNYEEFFVALYDNTHNFTDVASSVIKIAKYMDMATRVANQQINLSACLYDLFVIEE
jgi:replication factor C small subunit